MTARTLADIARLAGVSRTTASYVVNGQAEARRISSATVARVNAVIAEHDFRVDARAAALRRGETRTLGLILPDLENLSYARLAKHIERGARRAGYQLFVVDSDDDPDTERTLVAALRARRCDALIVASCLSPDDPFYAEIVADGLPVIGFDRPLDPTRLCSVASANESAAYELASAVRSRINGTALWLDAVPWLSITQRRRAGYERALAARGASSSAACTGVRYDRATGARLMQAYLAEHAPPAAVITAAYPLLDGALDVLLDHGTSRPKQALPQLATFGDHRLLDFLPTTVHTMAQQHDILANQVLKRLWAALADEYLPGHDRIPRVLRRRDNRP
ncbi:catabolite repressor/activator [Salinisphaera sp. Q1T1-3]|uniref:catabolite repressor/activator n=1 Tax=Salinisphaera sp. Q1T1-3 TaxID=2321229 RepID=UPI000E771823|nr:catabolite repressor/activator [Salinisphaera sp. Q1T1-3]RJS94141.1 catabolite repressor/activator [Salinisphaera sp. Q1T1-3]